MLCEEVLMANTHRVSVGRSMMLVLKEDIKHRIVPPEQKSISEEYICLVQRQFDGILSKTQSLISARIG